jgi:heterodisulfide reductase subunit C
MKQWIFIAILAVTIIVFLFSVSRIIANFRLTKPAYKVKDFWKRMWMTMKVAFFQDKIFRNPVAGTMHALLFWGFCAIVIGSLEMVLDGVLGIEKSLSVLGIVYDILIAVGDVSAYLIGLFVVIFMLRRFVLNIKRLHGYELSLKNHSDAIFALFMILLLMVSLAAMNYCYLAYSTGEVFGVYPVSQFLLDLVGTTSNETSLFLYELNWWVHILLIFFFANILPYSKHFHIFMSIPNVFCSRLEPLGKLPNMDSVTKEVKLMMDPATAYASPQPGEQQEVSRFGVLDAEDFSWKNYMDSLTCTQCGRCTSVCPANQTGKKLSPRKIIIDARRRMKDKGPGLRKDGKAYSDKKTFIRDYILEEEIWACTTCNACAKECPLNINHPTLIVDLRRYLVMEESAAPSGLNTIFTNIENNGAPWQFSPEDRLLWTE